MMFHKPECCGDSVSLFTVTVIMALYIIFVNSIQVIGYALSNGQPERSDSYTTACWTVVLTSLSLIVVASFILVAAFSRNTRLMKISNLMFTFLTVLRLPLGIYLHSLKGPLTALLADISTSVVYCYAFTVFWNFHNRQLRHRRRDPSNKPSCLQQESGESHREHEEQVVSDECRVKMAQ